MRNKTKNSDSPTFVDEYPERLNREALEGSWKLEVLAVLESTASTPQLTSETWSAFGDFDFSTHFHSLTKSSQSRQLLLTTPLPPIQFEFAPGCSNEQAVN